MTLGEIKTVYEHLPAAGQSSDSMVIMLHGLGSNGQDLISLAPLWAGDLPNTVFISPDAPFACDMVPPGYPNAHQWFSLRDRHPDKILEGVKIAAPLLQEFIEQELQKHGISANRLVLCGFSQGAMMSLYAGPRYKEQIAGILGFSGAMVGEPGKHKMPVCLVHGDDDDVVPVKAYHHAREVLEQNGFEVSGHTTPNLPHSIDENGIKSGKEFLKSRLL